MIPLIKSIATKQSNDNQGAGPVLPADDSPGDAAFGGHAGAAETASGKAFSRGNNNGQVGDGTYMLGDKPVSVLGLSNFRNDDGGYHFSLAATP